MNVNLLYVTCGSEAEAERIARALVEARLAACGNILPGMRSLYWWNGSVQEEGETVLLLKTTAAMTDAAVERVVELHSYDTPCVVAVPVAGGNPDFLAWIAQEADGTER